ncbi:hypothetical protein Tco_1455781 [Tanacetum coccineum]
MVHKGVAAKLVNVDENESVNVHENMNADDNKNVNADDNENVNADDEHDNDEENKQDSSEDEQARGDDREDFIVDEEHMIDEVEVNMEGFTFCVLEQGADAIVTPNVDLTDEALEVLDFDSFDSDVGDDTASIRRRDLRKLRKTGGQSCGIVNTLFVGQEFPNKELAKARIIKAHAVETRRKIGILKNDNERVQAKCKGNVPMGVSKTKDFRAKAKVEVHLRGDQEQQYALLKDYCDSLKKANPNTTIKIDVYRAHNLLENVRRFKRIYVCLGPLKDGFRASGRQLLGLDGAFMKWNYPRQMITAVSVDANIGIYPVAYRIVELESKDSWTWFLSCLGDDFDLYANSNFTFITDRQKGLLPALQDLFPAAEHRYCVRHIHDNMNLIYKGGHYKELLWKCVTATTKFSGRANCDLLINNICEVFNRQFLKARDSLVITALEYVKEYLMKRVVIVQKVNEVACIFNMTDNGMQVGFPEDWVHQSTRLQTWKTVYSFKINPVPGREFWEKSQLPSRLIPPYIPSQIGRPGKKRKKSAGEVTEMVKNGKLTRKGGTVTRCKYGQKGHNKRSCKGPSVAGSGSASVSQTPTSATQPRRPS